MESLKHVFKVPLNFHWSTLLLLALLIWQAGPILGIIFFTVLMFSLLVHEYAHVWAAIDENMDVEKVIVFALGAGAMVDSDRIMFDRRAGLKVSLAGPLGSFALAGLGGIGWVLLPNIITLYFFLINIAFGIFNLLPMFPSDGGRILYSLLSYKFSFEKSAKIAVITSYIVCALGAFASFWFGLWWMFGLFGFLILFAYHQYESFKRALYKY